MILLLILTMSSFTMASQNKNYSITDALNEIVSTNEIPGLQYTVIDDTGIVFEYANGLQNVASNIKVSENSIFMLNSITKVFTAAAILQLSAKGEIDLDRKLSDYYSDHPYGDTVTIRHLLSHTSGIPNPLPIKWLHFEASHGGFDEDAALANVLAGEPTLSFLPGEKYAYSNIAYWLLGKVIEKITGMGYCEHLRQAIFDPLGITTNELNCSMPDDNKLATGYQKKYSFLSLFLFVAGASEFFGDTEQGYLSFKRVYHNGPSYGGLYGTGRGLGKFLNDMLRDTSVILSKEARELFFSRQKNNNGELMATSLGWRYGIVEGNVYYEKPGGGPGTHGNIRIYPDKKIATVFLANKTEVQEKPISRFSTMLDKLFLERKYRN